MADAEIFTYNASEPLYAMHWSARPQKDFRLALGSFKPDRNNSLEVVELNQTTGTFQFESRLWTDHGFPATKVMFAPDTSHVDLLATASDTLRLWKVTETDLIEEASLIADKHGHYGKPLTSFDWRDPPYIATCSIDHSCAIWDVERQMVEKRLVAHSDEVNDVAWSSDHGRFATVSSDGSVRLFDKRQLPNASLLYENPATPLVRVAWNHQDPRYLATFARDSHRVIVLDIRYPTPAVAELEKHKGYVNAIAWAPHSSCHICTAGDDAQALIWDLKGIQQLTERHLDPILSYTAVAEILQVQWSAGRSDWIAVCFEKMAQILRVVTLSSTRPVRRLQQRGVARSSVITCALELSNVSAKKSQAAESVYNADQIQVLEGLDPVRRRPGMYIGSTSQKGLHHLVYEVLDNAIDEVQAGHADTVHLDIDLDSGRVSISDNGRGIPTEMHPQTKISALETVLTVLHAGGKFGGSQSGYTVSGGLHGVGLSVVNALSESLDVTVWRGGQRFTQSFARGVPASPMVTAKQTHPIHSGTKVEFKYDSKIFSAMAQFDAHVLTSRFREVAFLNSAVTLHYRFRESTAEAEWKSFHYEGGLKEYVEWLNRDKTPLHKAVFFSEASEDVQVEVALQWCADSFSESLVGFVNTVKTIDGGTHLEGFKAALTRSLNALARRTNLLKENETNLSGDYLREGLAAVISVKVTNPEFEGQTKTRLGNAHVRRIVDQIVSEELTSALELDSSVLQSVFKKAFEARKAAEAARRARELVRRKSLLTRSTLPGKLADCTNQSEYESEIFIVEGDSAGGSTKQGRDRRFQAVLPLRGKILNTERSDESAIYKNNELTSLIVALGLEHKTEDLKNLRYDKIIVLTDADVDGAHIRTLLLTFLYRFRRSLFEQGKVYVAVPPLFKVKVRGGTKYCYSDREVTELTKSRKQGAYTIQRFKGLGEMMPGELWETTLDPKNRILRRLTVDDFVEADHIFNVLMGNKVEPRKKLIEEEGSKLSLLDLDI